MVLTLVVLVACAVVMSALSSAMRNPPWWAMTFPEHLAWYERVLVALFVLGVACWMTLMAATALFAE